MIEYIKQAEKKIPTFRGIKYSHLDLSEATQCVVYGGKKYNILWGVDQVYCTSLPFAEFINIIWERSMLFNGYLTVCTCALSCWFSATSGGIEHGIGCRYWKHLQLPSTGFQQHDHLILWQWYTHCPETYGHCSKRNKHRISHRWHNTPRM